MAERKVFLSSTFKDLTDYREAVYRAIQKMDNWRCVCMEDFGARDREADKFCREKVAECDLFIGILGILYGAIHKTSGLSYTEREYQAAATAKKPRLMFLSPDDFPVPGNLMEDKRKQRLQKAFRKRVSSERIRDANWTSPDQLATSVVTAIHNWEKEHSAKKTTPKKHSQPPSTSDRQVRNRYLEWMVKNYGRLVLYGIQSQTQPYIELDLDDIYVHLEALEILSEKEFRHSPKFKRKGETPKAHEPTVNPINLKDLLKVGPRIVLIGGPGSGKSTVLHHIACTLARSLLEDKPELAHKRLGITGPIPIPILVPLHTFAEHRIRCSQLIDPELSTLAACIFDYLVREKGGLSITQDFFKGLLRNGNCLIMLDGLDEVASEEERELVCKTIESLANWSSDNRYIITSRAAAYTGQAVITSDFHQVYIKPLSPNNVKELVKKLYLNAGHEDRIESLLSWLEEMEKRFVKQSLGEKRLIDSPLMVRMVAIVDLSQEKLPEQRAGLYNRFVDTILQATYHPDAKVRQFLEKMGGLPENKRQWLAVLAHAMHTQGSGTRFLEENQVQDLLRQHLIPDYGKKTASEVVKQFIATIRSRGGLIEVRSGPPDRWSFTHHPFQEFLTAVYLADITDEVSAIADELEKDGRISEPWWQEVVLLLLGYLSFRNTNKANRLAQRLARLPELKAPIPPLNNIAQLAAAERVAVALIERQGSPQQLKTEVANRLTTLITDTTLTTNGILRATAGRALAKLGDPRFRPDAFWLPNEPLLGFVEIPSGTFIMGTEEKEIPALTKKFGGKKDWCRWEVPQQILDLQMFYISRYPVTNAQFNAFVEASGYSNLSYWEEAKSVKVWEKNGYVNERWSKKLRNKPVGFVEPFNLPNHPVVGVNWYEALAYTKWLTEQLRTWPGTPESLAQLLREKSWVVTLPSEAQWEKAVRGEDGRIFPWENNEVDPNLANYDKTGIGTTSAVGCFTRGASPYGVLDMSGNVWEWCRTKWQKNYINYRNNNSLE